MNNFKLYRFVKVNKESDYASGLPCNRVTNMKSRGENEAKSADGTEKHAKDRARNKRARQELNTQPKRRGNIVYRNMKKRWCGEHLATKEAD